MAGARADAVAASDAGAATTDADADAAGADATRRNCEMEETGFSSSGAGHSKPFRSAERGMLNHSNCFTRELAMRVVDCRLQVLSEAGFRRS